MRTVALTVFAIALAAAGASATCAKPQGYLYNDNSCPAFNTCGATFCSCAGSTSTNATTCLSAAASATCTTVQACMLSYQQCLENLVSYRSNASSPCFTVGSNIHTARLAAASGGYAMSGLQKSCSFRTCEILNATALTCSFGANDTNVCMMPAATTTTAAPVATPPPSSLPPNFVAAITATIKIDGSAFAQLLTGNRAALETAVKADLATLLQVASAAFIQITNMYIGSLVVDFAVDASAGVAPTTLSANLLTATSSNSWLSSTQGVYTSVSNETLAVTTLPTITAVAPPGAVTPVPPTTTAAPDDISASAGVTSAAAMLIAAVAVIAAF